MHLGAGGFERSVEPGRDKVTRYRRARSARFLVLALALLVPGSLTPLGLSEPSEEPRALRDYLHDVSRPIPGVDQFSAILEHHRIPSTDGARMDTWTLRPDLPGQVPLILIITPYQSGSPQRVNRLFLHGVFDSSVRGVSPSLTYLNVLGPYLSRGYAVGVSSVRGTGNSEGCFLTGGRQEALDSAAVIDALAAEPWSNGRVGLLGVSLDGTTAQDVWVEAPSALKTIVPVAALSDHYKLSYVNGVPSWSHAYTFTSTLWPAPEGPEAPYGATDPASFVSGEAGKACPEQVDIQREAADSIVDGDKDAFWQSRDFLAELHAAGSRPRASVYFVHGFEDWNVKTNHLEDWLDALWASGVPMKAMLGQWAHSWPDREDWLEVSTAWFDLFLKGVDTGILDAPLVQVASDDGVWRHEAIWPPDDIATVTFHPRQDGTLGTSAGAGEASYETTDANLALQIAHMPDLLPRDMVVWESEPLDEDLHLAGQPVFEADVTASATRAALVLTMMERGPDGDRPVNYAVMSLNHVQSLERGNPDIAGATQRVRVRFFPQDDVVRAGNRIVLVAAGNTIGTHDLTDLVGQAERLSFSAGLVVVPPAEPGTITIHLDGASLRLPTDPSIVPEPRN